MRKGNELNQHAIVTPSGKQIVLQNNLEQVFGQNQMDLVSPLMNRETPQQDFKTSFYFTSPGDINFMAPYSPIFLGTTYSPMNKVGGVSFYETFSRNLKTPKNNSQASFITGATNSQPSKFDAVIPDLLDQFDRQSLISNLMPVSNTPVFLNKTANESIAEKSRFPNSSESSMNMHPSKADALSATASTIQNQSGSATVIVKNELDVSKYGSALVRLGELFRVLNNVFNHRPIQVEEYVKLGPFEEELLNSILQRKFLKKLRPRDFELAVEKKVELINEIVNTKSHKRPEECYKFVLTRVIKHLKKYLKTFSPGLRNVEGHFYEFYFGATAKQTGLSLDDFHYPLTGDKGKFKLNSKYFERIFKSQEFLERLVIYMNGQLERDYRIEIAKKLDSLLLRWDTQIAGDGPNQLAMENVIREYLLKNKRCKLPWTINEVYEAIDRFKSLLTSFKIAVKAEGMSPSRQN
jgi:hypothetical protein